MVRASIVIAVVVAVSILALLFIPVRTEARELTVTSSNPATTTFSFSMPGWVTVHFDRHGTLGMRYWMDGPAGMMFNRSMMSSGMMGGSDSYSFWTWGGNIRCGAEYSGGGSAPMPVWVNMTWGVL